MAVHWLAMSVSTATYSICLAEAGEEARDSAIIYLLDRLRERLEKVEFPAQVSTRTRETLAARVEQVKGKVEEMRRMVMLEEESGEEDYYLRRAPRDYRGHSYRHWRDERRDRKEMIVCGGIASLDADLTALLSEEGRAREPGFRLLGMMFGLASAAGEPLRCEEREVCDGLERALRVGEATCLQELRSRVEREKGGMPGDLWRYLQRVRELDVELHKLGGERRAMEVRQERAQEEIRKGTRKISDYRSSARGFADLRRREGWRARRRSARLLKELGVLSEEGRRKIRLAREELEQAAGSERSLARRIRETEADLRRLHFGYVSSLIARLRHEYIPYLDRQAVETAVRTLCRRPWLVRRLGTKSGGEKEKKWQADPRYLLAKPGLIELIRQVLPERGRKDRQKSRTLVLRWVGRLLREEPFRRQLKMIQKESERCRRRLLALEQVLLEIAAQGEGERYEETYRLRSFQRTVVVKVEESESLEAIGRSLDRRGVLPPFFFERVLALEMGIERLRRMALALETELRQEAREIVLGSLSCFLNSGRRIWVGRGRLARLMQMVNEALRLREKGSAGVGLKVLPRIPQFYREITKRSVAYDEYRARQERETPGQLSLGLDKQL